MQNLPEEKSLQDFPVRQSLSPLQVWRLGSFDLYGLKKLCDNEAVQFAFDPIGTHKGSPQQELIKQTVFAGQSEQSATVSHSQGSLQNPSPSIVW